MRTSYFLALGLAISTAMPAAPLHAAEDDPLLGGAMQSLFNPRTAPVQRSMGLLQRSFLDLVEESRPKLEIAFVVDGTESMGGQLDSVRSAIRAMLGDLELYKQNNIRYQLVVYRDAGAPSGEVVLPLQSEGNAFVADREAIAQAFDQLQAETGAPYFPELPDKGVDVALTQLPWSQDEETSRWIFLFGDAPPFDPSFDEPENKASRRVSTEKLASMAAVKSIRINCVLCNSRGEDQEAYEAVLDQTRRFMNDLSSNSGGLMLDLSYPDIRSAIAKSIPKQQVKYREIGFIRMEDVRQVQRDAESSQSVFAAGNRVRVATLPHLPLDNMSFDPSFREVQLATELRQRLRVLPGVEFKDTSVVKDRYRDLARRGLRGNAILQMLARALSVDYVVWGTLQERDGALVATTGIYEPVAGRSIIQAQAATNQSSSPDLIGGRLADQLISSNVPAAADNRLRILLASARQDDSQRSQVTAQLASGSGLSPLMEGKEALEQALAYPVGSDDGGQLLAEARSSLQEAVESDKDNALASFLLASCLFNEARAKQQAGDRDAARGLMHQFAIQLSSAYSNRSQNRNSPAVRTEIEADYALFIGRNPTGAIELYRRMLDESAGVDMQSAKRAYWMLGGIYSGDWGVAEEYVDTAETKKCLTQILALWPDSSEAKLIKRILRWDESKDETRFQHFPLENGELVEMTDRDA